MTNAREVQALLRFLSQDAKIPLAAAMGNIKALQKAELVSPESIAKASLKDLKDVFSDEKLAKQVANAAKRMSKKRALSAAGEVETPRKKTKPAFGEIQTPLQIEESLELPKSDSTEEELCNVVLYTNRAPLVLAFAVVLLKYTMPTQPLSTHLSLAQAVVSMNSRSKAVSIGIESGKSAEEEGWGEGQPTVKVMGREVRVLKRWGYDWKVSGIKSEDKPDTQASSQTVHGDEEPALWALDLEALKKSGDPGNPSTGPKPGAQLPIYTAQSARSYLLKSFELPPEAQKSKRKSTQTAESARLEGNLANLLAALDIVYRSWADVLEKDDLDKRAWAWYLKVRPDVEQGRAGWGGKGGVSLSSILELKRTD